MAIPYTWETELSAGKDKKEVFTKLLQENKIGGLAVLRNLRNMHESGVNEKLVSETLLKQSGKSKILPFRYLAASRVVPQWENFIDEAMLKSTETMEKSQGKTLLLVDVSGSMEYKGSVECLWEIFGGTITDKGYKMLDSHVGLIYGDSITLDRASEIMKRLEAKGFASGNVVFGIGSFTYQYQTRDSYGFAMKATYGVVNGEGREIYKDPATDKGNVKKSAKGLLRVEKEENEFILYDQQTPEQEHCGELQIVFEDGGQFNTQSLDSIRNTLHG